jgi:hypothetical protein
MLQGRQKHLPMVVPYLSELQRIHQDASRTNNIKYMNKYHVMIHFN